MSVKNAKEPSKISGRVYNRYDQEKFSSNSTEYSEFGLSRLTNQTSTAKRSKFYNPNLYKSENQKKRKLIPIIIVPSSNLKSLINITNIIPFLENFKYVDTSENRIKSGSKIILKKKDEQLTIQIVDQPTSQLSKEDWERVVGVFVHGPAWQFKNWPFKNGVTEIFSKGTFTFNCKLNFYSQRNSCKMG
ncbi:MAG: accessory factor associated with RNA polymerase II [Paramarteilia canceri]